MDDVMLWEIYGKTTECCRSMGNYPVAHICPVFASRVCLLCDYPSNTELVLSRVIFVYFDAVGSPYMTIT